MQIMSYTDWHRRTKQTGKKRSPELKSIDNILKSFNSLPDFPPPDNLISSIHSWMCTKNGRWMDSIRNHDGAVFELYHQAVYTRANVDFQSNPLFWMQTHSVKPGGGPVPGDDDFTRYNITDNNKIQEAYITQENAAELGAYALNPQGAGKPMRFKIYWLPWSPQRIVAMGIPQKNPLLKTPNVYFTAAISGCSVFVDGPAHAPCTYHAGIGTSLDKNAFKGADVRLASDIHLMGFVNSRNAVRFWRRLYVIEAPYKNGSNFGRNPLPDVGEVNKDMYTINVVQKHYQTVRSQALKDSIQNNHNNIVHLITNPPGLEPAPWGCVFGIRTGNNWCFYLQENVTIRYVVRATLVKYTWTFPMAITKFYPLPLQTIYTYNNLNNLNLDLLQDPPRPGATLSHEMLPLNLMTPFTWKTRKQPNCPWVHNGQLP